MSVALRGNLQDFGIAEVFQLIGQQRKTGLLDITADGQTMRLAFDSGCVVWARPLGVTEDAVVGERLVRCGLLTQKKLEEFRRESEVSARSLGTLAVDSDVIGAPDVEQIEELITNETIFTVLRWSGGSFDFSAQPVTHDRPAEKLLAAEQILMDGLRMVDEWQTFASLVPSDDAIFERCGLIESYRQSPGLEETQRLPRVEKVFALIDGRLPVQRIIDLSRLGLFDATRALAELHHSGLIRQRSRGEKRIPKPDRDVPEKAVAERARWWLAAAFPLALLSLVVSVIFSSGGLVAHEGIFPIERRPLEASRAVFERARLRHELEAYRLLYGRWPDGLDELYRAPLASAPGLAAPDAEPYYYARRGSGIVLLAPRR